MLWDLPGREDMDLRESYYRNVDAAIGTYCQFYTLTEAQFESGQGSFTLIYCLFSLFSVVVDMTDDASIELASTWKQEFINKVSRVRLVTEKQPDGFNSSHYESLPCDPKEIPILLLGNKYDLVSIFLA